MAGVNLFLLLEIYYFRSFMSVTSTCIFVFRKKNDDDGRTFENPSYTNDSSELRHYYENS